MRPCTGWRECWKRAKTGFISPGGWSGCRSKISAWPIPERWSNAWRRMQAVHFLGIPEGDLALAQAAIYLSVAPKSDASYQALNRVVEEIQTHPAEPVPMHLRNAVTSSMKEWGYGQGYQHAHKIGGCPYRIWNVFLPRMAGKKFYEPTDRGIEKRISERIEEIRRRRSTLVPDVLLLVLPEMARISYCYNRVSGQSILVSIVRPE